MMNDYEHILLNLKELNCKDGQEYLRILSVVTEIMKRTMNKELKGAVYTNDFKHDRLRLKLLVGKHYD
jgi:hypothetical protein